MSLIDLVHEHIGANGVSDIAQQLGIDEGTAQQAIQAAVPMMVGGMAQTAQQPSGEQAISSLLGGGGLGGILGGILGQHQGTVQDGVQQASGLDAGKAGKLLMLLAPFVLRALAKHQSSGGVLSGSLQQEAANAMDGAPAGVGGILGKILGG